MSSSYTAHKEDGQNQVVILFDLPDECPQCHVKGTHAPSNLFLNTKRRELEVVFRCPNSKCYEVFIGYYFENTPGTYHLKNTDPTTYQQHVFPEVVKKISQTFIEIYNQALSAETIGLDQICGPGYRKALEFLVKDYLITKTEDKKELIREETLGDCIAERISNKNIKDVAKRAVWLGNDETHYVRKWEKKIYKI